MLALSKQNNPMTLPLAYVKAGQDLLVCGPFNFFNIFFVLVIWNHIFSSSLTCWNFFNLLQNILDNKNTAFPLSSEQILSILDEANEKTFLCSQGDVSKIGLEEKNLVASLGFIVEQTLVSNLWMKSNFKFLYYIIYNIYIIVN